MSRRRTAATRTGARSRGLVATVAVGSIAAVGLGVAALAVHRSTDDLVDEREALEAAESAAQFQGVVDELAWTHHDAVADGVAGLVTDDVDAVDWDEVADLREGMLDELDSLAGDEHVGEAASDLADEIRDLAESGVGDIDTADNVHWAAQFHDDDGSVYLGLAAHLVAIDPAVALLQPRLEELPEGARGYVDFQAENAVEVPGWLFGDRDQPFADPFLPDSVDADSGDELPPEVVQITELAESYTSDAATRLWDTDLWWFENADYGPVAGAPFGLDAVFADADVAADDLRAAMQADDRVEAAERDAEIESLGRDITLRRIVSVLLAVLAVAALVPVVIAVVRRLRTMSVDTVTDPLTGAWNRRFLDSATLRRGLEAREHRVVAVTDLDRFKMVNDSWGHAVGDEVLREVVRRLRARVDDLVRDGLAAEGWLIRSGGDEFVIVLSSDRPIDTHTVVDRIRSVAGPVGVGHLCDTASVELLLSVGAVASDGSTDEIDLDAMITAADLAAYEDKAARGHAQATVPAVQRSDSGAST